MEQNDKSMEVLAAAWKEKETSFTNQITKLDMEESEIISLSDKSGFMILTYSGSLIGSGPEFEDGRTVLYECRSRCEHHPISIRCAGKNKY